MLNQSQRLASPQQVNRLVGSKTSLNPVPRTTPETECGSPGRKTAADQGGEFGTEQGVPSGEASKRKNSYHQIEIASPNKALITASTDRLGKLRQSVGLPIELPLYG